MYIGIYTYECFDISVSVFLQVLAHSDSEVSNYFIFAVLCNKRRFNGIHVKSHLFVLCTGFDLEVLRIDTVA